MWNSLPSDLLANVFSFLSPATLAIASSTCKHWHSTSKAYPLLSHSYQPWLITFPTRNRTLLCYAHDPHLDNWYAVSLDFIAGPVRPIAPIGSLILFRPFHSTSFQLGLCNPFTRQGIRRLPQLNITRTNPAVGVIELGPSRKHDPFPHFRLYVAGGMCEAALGGASYEPTLEMYDSRCDKWEIVGQMPVAFAVRIAVWTPNESVHCEGVLYWITSSRAYSIMSYRVGANKWTELSVPMADRLGFASLVLRNGKATLVGGTCDGDVLIWELGRLDLWVLVETLPDELGRKCFGVRGSWGGTRCVGRNGAVWLYRDLWSGMVVWREVVGKGRWEWSWVEGCCSLRGKEVQNYPITGVLLHPSLAHSVMLGN